MMRFLFSVISVFASLFSLFIIFAVMYGTASIGASLYKANLDCSKNYKIERYVHGDLFCEEEK